MSEPTTDEKIQMLVRSVLEAVDSRLDAVRHEVAGFAADVEERHHQLLGTVAEIDRRLATLERADQGGGTNAAGVTERLDQMSARLDLLARTTLDHSTSAAGATTPEACPPVAVAAPLAPLPTAVPAHDLSRPSDLSAISRPLIDHAHVTTQVPIVPDHAIHRITALPIPAAVTPTMYSPPGMSTDLTLAANDVEHAVDHDEHHEQEDEIDLDQLTALLTERLGHLSLPPRPE